MTESHSVFCCFFFLLPNCFSHRWHHHTWCRWGHVSPVERRDMDGRVWSRFHPFHAGICPSRHPVQHPGLPHNVLHCTCLCQGSAAWGWYTTHRRRSFLRYDRGFDAHTWTVTLIVCLVMPFYPWPLRSSVGKNAVPDDSKFTFQFLSEIIDNPTVLHYG